MTSYPLIKQQQLRELSELVEFLQARGWDIQSIEVYRYDNEHGLGPLSADAEPWQAREWRWGIRLCTAPREQDDEGDVPARERIP